MESWVAVVGDGIDTYADELAGATGCVVDDGGAEGTERTGRGQVVEGLDCYSHPFFSDVEGYRCGFLGEDGLVVSGLLLVAMAVRCREYCCEGQEDGLYEHSGFMECATRL